MPFQGINLYCRLSWEPPERSFIDFYQPLRWPSSTESLHAGYLCREDRSAGCSRMDPLFALL